MFEQADSLKFIDITVIHIALYLLIPVLLSGSRLRALISASFAFSVINLAHLPISFFIFYVISPFINTLSYAEYLQKNPAIYYCGIFINNIVISVFCIFAARWLRESKFKPPLMVYLIFNLLFILLPLAILVWYEDIINVIYVSLLTSAIISMLFLLIVLFLFYLYTRTGNITADLNVTENLSSLKADKEDKYMPFMQVLSRRELEVIEAILAGNVRYKQLSAALNISVSTVKTHLIHIYQTTGVSSIAALSSLFYGYTPKYLKINHKSTHNQP